MVKVVTYILENDTTVQGLLGEKSHGDNHKVYPVVVEGSESAPFISVRLLSAPRLGKGLTCGKEYLVMVACWVGSYDDLDTLSEACISAIEGNDGTVNGEDVTCSYEDQSDLDFDKDHHLYGRGLTFKVIS